MWEHKFDQLTVKNVDIIALDDPAASTQHWYLVVGPLGGVSGVLLVALLVGAEVSPAAWRLPQRGS